MEKKLSQEIIAKVEEIRKKLADGKELTSDDLGVVAGGNAALSDRSPEEEYNDLVTVYKNFGPDVGYYYASGLYGKEIVDDVYGRLPYDVYGTETLREIIRVVYHTEVGGGTGGTW